MNIYIFIVVIFAKICLVEAYVKGSKTWPSLYWDPRSPFFRCPDPLIRIRYGDQIPTFCPNLQRNNFLQERLLSRKLSENLYLVPDEEHFNNCNATEGIEILSCDGTISRDANCRYPCKYTRSLIFAEKVFNKDLHFEKGKMYYFIGTGFRTYENVKNKIGGSCNTTRFDQVFENKLRLKIYVCTDEEVARGECERCTSEGCYYQNCKSDCGLWKNMSYDICENKNGKCYIQQTRICTNDIVNSKRTETRSLNVTCPTPKCSNRIAEKTFQTSPRNCFQRQTRQCVNEIDNKTYSEFRIDKTHCPQMNCSSWMTQTNKLYTVNGICFSPQKRVYLHYLIEEIFIDTRETVVACPNITCSNWFTENTKTSLNIDCVSAQKRICFHPLTGVMVEENRQINVSCPAVVPKTQASGRQVENNDNEIKLYKYLAIATTLSCFLIGVLLGVFCVKHCHKKETAIEPKFKVACSSFENKQFNLAVTPQRPTILDFTSPPMGNYCSISPISYITGSNSLYLPDADVFTLPRRNSDPSESPPGRRPIVSGKPRSISQILDESDRLSRNPNCCSNGRPMRQLSMNSRVRIIEEV